MSVAVRSSVPVIQLQTFGELVQFAERAARSTMVPPGFKGKPDDIVLAVQLGSELGLAPMQSLQSIAVINGRPAVWGDAMVGLVRQSPHCENLAEKLEGEGDNLTAICIAKRKGADAVTSKFSVSDAKKAGLWNKQGPWTQYPSRMLQQRARGFALRDAFADVLKGLKSAEELRDYPTKGDAYDGVTIEAEPTRHQTVNDAPTARAINDAIPALETPEALRNRADRLITVLAALPDADAVKYERAEKNSRNLLADIAGLDDEAAREDLHTMVMDALAFARTRCIPHEAPAYAEADAS